MIHSETSEQERLAQAGIFPRYALWAGLASIVTVTVLIIAKTAAYSQSGSASVLASLIDSLVDASVSIMSFMAIRLSLKPADANHRFGHGKVEGLAALGQAALIALAGLALIYEAVQRFFNPQPVADHGLAVGVMIFAIILTAALVTVQNYVLKRAPSLAVEADRAHYQMDIIINGGVIIVLAGLYYGAPLWLDPVFALLVALYLARTVKQIGLKGLDMLLDRELPDEIRHQITAEVLAHDGVLGMHDLRTYRSGMRTFISFDIEADPSILLWHAHEIVRAVERRLLTMFPHAEILIHVDPYGDTDDSRHVVRGIHDQGH